jgi:tetratricopeptide (TPR) repeat protein
MRNLLLVLALAAPLFAQTPVAPSAFRLVAPHSRGALLIDTTGGWKINRVVLYENGQRPVVQMSNEKSGVVVSYMLDDEPKYNDTTEMCRNDMLGGVMKGIGKVSEISNKESGEITLPDGQTMLTGSFFVRKQDGHELHQQTLWGFIAAHHLCAAVHLSRTPANPGDNSTLEPVLKSVHFDPEYQPTATDLATMARLLPPQEASLYGAAAPASITANATNQTLAPAPQSLEFALPGHPGWLAMDAPNYAIMELSAKPSGMEFGIRADDASLHTEVLGFLFISAPPHPSAVACRDWMLEEEKKSAEGRRVRKTYETKSHSGVPLAIVEYETPKAPLNFRFSRRVFAADGDLCADIMLSAESATKLGPGQILLDTLRFEPKRKPDFDAAFRYAQVIFDHQDYAGAAPYFERAIPLATSVPEAQKWQRIATDQAVMAYGMAGDLKRSRATAEAAIARDPDYPLYYYNLACADAESGDTVKARTHLQQAFDRRANTIKGEKLPDPSKDDSILKLKNNKAFWAFVQSLPKG